MNFSNEIEKENAIQKNIEFKADVIITKWQRILHCLADYATTLLPAGVIAFLIPIFFTILTAPSPPPLSVQKLEKVNKVILYDILSLDQNTALYQLQNQIHKDLLKDNEKINYNIANQELLSIDLITQEFLGSHGIAIGNTSTIDIETNNKNTLINYNNFTEEGKAVIVKQLDKKNYPKINLKYSVKQNDDKTYTIEVVIKK